MVARWSSVAEPPRFRARCLRCARIIDGPKWADLNGPAFQAYYCAPCKSTIETGAQDHDHHHDQDR